MKISLAAAILAGAVCLMMSFVMAHKRELILEWIQLGCLIVALSCILDYAIKNRKDIFSLFQAGAIICFSLGQVYWVLHLLILGYDNENFGISDLSWVGFYLFLYSSVFGILDPIADNKRKSLKKYRVAALIAPAAMIVSGVFQLSFAAKDGINDIFYVTVYTAVMAPLSYSCLKLLLIPAKGNFRLRVMRPYIVIVFLILITDTVWTFADYIQHGMLYCLSDYLLSVLLLFLVPAACRGAEQWKTC